MSTPPLNFQRAQYEGEPVSQNECAYCGRGFTTEYYRVGGHAACPVCAQQAQSLVPPNSHKVFLHALSLGAAAAVVGCIGYAMVIIVTGWTIGYAAIGVGFLIGWAMRKTAGQHGGRRYQWAAAVLTYVAVSMAFVPIAIHTSSHSISSIRFGGFVIYLAIGLISPFLELTSSIGGGLLNLFIIFIGVRYAWQMMAVRTVEVDGPFEASAG